MIGISKKITAYIYRDSIQNLYATVFPQSITITGSRDKYLMHCEATVISDEARAKCNGWLIMKRVILKNKIVFKFPPLTNATVWIKLYPITTRLVGFVVPVFDTIIE